MRLRINRPMNLLHNPGSGGYFIQRNSQLNIEPKK